MPFRIIVPKFRNAAKRALPLPTPPSSSGEDRPSNPFASSGLKFASTNSTASTGSSLFSPAAASTTVKSTNLFNPIGSSSPAPLFGASQPQPLATVSKSDSQDLDDDTKIKYRALNEKFSHSLSDLVNINVYGDYSSVVEKYLKYATKIKTESMSSSTSSTLTAPAPVPAPAAFSFSSTAAKTPTFAPLPTSLPSSFTTQATSTPTSNLFSSSPPKASEPSKPLFAFGAPKQVEKKEVDSKPSEDTPSSTEPASLKFVFNSTGATTSSPFSFDKTSTESKPNNDSGLKFEFKPSAKPTASAFTLASPVTTLEESKEDKPEEPKAAPKPLFSFGSTSTTFGSTTVTEKKDNTWAPENGIKFGTASSSTTAPSAPGKSLFGSATPADTNGTSKPLFGSPAPPSNGTPKPMFSFSTPAASNTPSPFMFGAGSSAAATSTNTLTQPFGTGAKECSSLFGSTPSVSSGSTTGLFGAPASGPASAPAFSFTFGQKSEASNTTESKPAEVAAAPAATTDGEEGEPEEPQSTVNFTAQGPGEENEESLYEKKAKVFRAVNGKMQSEGIGLLRVLKHRETQKARVVVRADGGGRVLLNALLHSNIPYKATGPHVSIMEVTADGPQQLTVRVKTAEDAVELAKTLEDNKNAA